MSPLQKRGATDSPAPDKPRKRTKTTARAQVARSGSAGSHGQQSQIPGFPGLRRLIPPSAYPTTFQHVGEPAARSSQNPGLVQQTAAPGFRVASVFTLEDANLRLPGHLEPDESRRRYTEIISEARYQSQHPPVLPPSHIEPVAPKEPLDDFLAIPDNVDQAERERREKYNNEIAAKLQRIDRERNNMAAKRSRASRLEALENSRRLLNEKAAECAWFRMKVLAIGGSTKDWDDVSAEVKEGMVDEIAERVSVVDRDNAEKKKREETARRIDRNKARAAEKRRRQKQPASPLAPDDAAQLGDMFDASIPPLEFPSFSTTLPSNEPLSSQLQLPQPEFVPDGSASLAGAEIGPEAPAQESAGLAFSFEPVARLGCSNDSPGRHFLSHDENAASGPPPYSQHGDLMNGFDAQLFGAYPMPPQGRGS